MLKRCTSRMHNEQKGITGLETAIILIAFVVVASVFAYTVLTAGIFAADRGREAVHAGLDAARSTIEPRGSVIALGNVTGRHVAYLTFTVSTALGGEAVNFNPPEMNATSGRAGANSRNVVVISFIDKRQHVQDLTWTKSGIGRHDGDNLLERDEKFQITVGPLAAALDPDLDPDQLFTIEIKPPVGAVINIERTIPARIDTVMNLN